MKRIILLFALLINYQLPVLAKGINITFNSNYSPLSLLEIITPAIQNGTVSYQQTTIKQKATQQSYSTALCLEMNSHTNEQQFNDFVNSLLSIKTDFNNYRLKIIKQCAKNLSPCFNSLDICSSSAFVGSLGFVDYVTQSQVSAALSEIAPMKTQIEIKINDGLVITNPEMIGLPNHSPHCSQITINANLDYSELVCHLQGNSIIENKSITWTRKNDGEYFSWHCSTDFNEEDKIKYAKICVY